MWFKVIFALRRVSLLAFFLAVFAIFDHESFLGTAADVELLSSYSKGALSTVSNLRRIMQRKRMPKLTNTGFDPK